MSRVAVGFDHDHVGVGSYHSLRCRGKAPSWREMRLGDGGSCPAAVIAESVCRLAKCATEMRRHGAMCFGVLRIVVLRRGRGHLPCVAGLALSASG